MTVEVVVAALGFFLVVAMTFVARRERRLEEDGPRNDRCLTISHDGPRNDRRLTIRTTGQETMSGAWVILLCN